MRLLGLLAGLSAVTDLGTGAPLDEALRRCVVATRLARVLGCPEPEVREVLYASLLQHLGCTAYAHEVAGIFHDDTATARLAFRTDFSRPADVWRTWVPGLVAVTGWSRARAIASTMVGGRRLDTEGPAATCEVARTASRRLGLPDAVQASLSAVFAMWNGRGYPRLQADEIPRSTRLVHVASTAVLFAEQAGSSAALREVERRSGTHLDPELGRAFADHSAEILEGLEGLDPYQTVLASEPDPVRLVDDQQLAEVCPHLRGSRRPEEPELARSLRPRSATWPAMRPPGSSGSPTPNAVRIAGYLHDLGTGRGSSAVWDKPGPLTPERAGPGRAAPLLHASGFWPGCPPWPTWAALAGQHHERMRRQRVPPGPARRHDVLSARVLAAADRYRCLVEPRPHRPPRRRRRGGASAAG